MVFPPHVDQETSASVSWFTFVPKLSWLPGLMPPCLCFFCHLFCRFPSGLVDLPQLCSDDQGVISYISQVLLMDQTQPAPISAHFLLLEPAPSVKNGWVCGGWKVLSTMLDLTCFC